MVEVLKKTLKNAFLLPFIVFVFLLILFLYPLWLLFAKVVSWIGSGNLRSVKGDVQTPVVYLENPNTKRTVVLVGMMHIGEKFYYSQIRELIASLNGFSVLYEWIKPLSEEEKTRLPLNGLGIVSELQKYSESSRKICEILGLEHQKEALPIDPSWINTDMRAFDLILYSAFHNLNFIKGIDTFEKILKVDSERARTRWLLNNTLKRIVIVMFFVRVYNKLTRKRRLMEKLIICHRNTIAFEGIREHLPMGNVVAIWGARHLPGIIKMLKREGFEEVDREWYTAYKAREYSLMNIFGERSVVAVQRLAAISD